MLAVIKENVIRLIMDIWKLFIFISLDSFKGLLHVVAQLNTEKGIWSPLEHEVLKHPHLDTTTLEY